MPKKILFHSAIHQFLHAAKELSPLVLNAREWREFLLKLNFDYLGQGKMEIHFAQPRTAKYCMDFSQVPFYFRGDNPADAQKQQENSLLFEPDQIQLKNAAFFTEQAKQVATLAGFSLKTNLDSDRLLAEETFHDSWALSVDPSTIDVRHIAESPTSPELRCIFKKLGNLDGKKVLDLGCGLGEASVYFALKGANVTASDLSSGMLQRTQELAKLNGTKLQTHLSSAESLNLPLTEKYDIIYAGNVLHHTSIEPVLKAIVTHLKEDGVFVSWDPVAYNPIINMYRKIAKKVRTEDEHPLRLADLRLMNSYFDQVEKHWFWLTTLLLFVWMAVVQRRDPNKERYWKVIIQEGNRWAPIYTPLETLDRVLLTILPFLRPLCWNVVVFCTKPKRN